MKTTKNTLFLLACAAVSAQAHAQSIEVFGILDAGINRTTGLAGGTKNSVVSGIMDGSRLGFKGNEDLGGGYKAIFLMEHRLEADTGTSSNRPLSGSQVPDRLATATLLGLPGAAQPIVNSVVPVLGNQIGVNLDNKFWDRQIYVGLVTPVGAILAGRQYTPAYEVAATFDTTSTQSALSNGQVGTLPPILDLRVDNSVAYRIQQGPVSAAAMVAAGENRTSTGRLLAFNVLYKASPFSAGVGYNVRRNELGQTSLKTGVLGASLEAGPGTIVTSIGFTKDDNPSGLSPLTPLLLANPASAPFATAVSRAYVEALKQDSRIVHLGYRLPMQAHTFYVAATHLNDKRPANADVLSYGGVYTYAFSKRTDLNFALVRFDNRNLAQAAPGQGGMVGGVTASAGTDSNSVSLGLRHRF